MDLSNVSGEAESPGEASFKMPPKLSKSPMAFHTPEFWSETPEATVNLQYISPFPPLPRVFMALAPVVFLCS